MINSFNLDLERKINNSLSNSFGKENFDEYRFGKFPSIGIWQRIKNTVKKTISYKSKNYFDSESNDLLNKYSRKLQRVYDILDVHGKELLVDLIAYKLLGYQKVKLPINTQSYWNALNVVKSLKNPNDHLDSKFIHIKLEKFNLKEIGFDLELYFNDLGIAIDYIFEQYAYKSGDERIVQVEKGDIVLDVGGCWGDTALYFAFKTGVSGKVFSFEFIPGNVEIFEKNLRLNKEFVPVVELIKNPVSDISDKKVYFSDNGPGSFISSMPQNGNDSRVVTTISIDDFIERQNINKVDFIKMDIEGAEPLALNGAIRTIKKYRPKLAIAIYHSMDDFVNIALWLKELNLDYKFYLGHYTLHAEETILFAKPR